VQIKQGDNWQALDPSRAEPTVGEHRGSPNEVTTVAAAQLNAKRYHRLTVQVIAERSDGGELTTATAVEKVVRPAAHMGQALTVSLAPLDWPSQVDVTGDQARANFRKAALEQDEWLPIIKFAGQQTKEASIRADGTLNQNPQTSTTGKAFQDAIGALGGGQSDSELTAVRLRFRIQAPGRGTVTRQRTIMDALGAEKRAQGKTNVSLDTDQQFQRSLAMFTQVRLMPQSCWVPADYLGYRMARGLVSNRMAVLGLIQAHQSGERERLVKVMGKIKTPPTQLLTLAGARRRFSPWGRQINLTQMNLISQFGQTQQVADQPAIRKGVDVIFNAVDPDPHAKVPARALRLAQGVADTNVETLSSPDNQQPLNTALAYANAQANGQPWQLLKQPKALASQANQFSAEAKQHMRAALEAGQVVLVSNQPVHAGAIREAVWWQIDPTTGTTLGMTGTGRGASEFAEYTAVEMIDNALQLGFAAYGYLSCASKSGRAEVCCLMTNAVGLGIGLGLGKAMQVGFAFAISELLGNLAWNLASTFGPGFSVCD
jgi:hypothetical protein